MEQIKLEKGKGEREQKAQKARAYTGSCVGCCYPHWTGC